MKYIKEQNRIIITDTQDFNVKQTLECGQIFRFQIDGDVAIVNSLDKQAKLISKENEIEIITDDVEYFEHFFDLKTDYSHIKQKLKKDKFLSTAVEYGYGIRILNNDINVNYGSIYENVVAQELKSHNYNLFYYNSKKNGEVDFIIENGTEVLPIEVKSGKDYKRHVALENLLNNDSYNINKAYTLCQGNIKCINNRIYLPIYMIMFFEKKKDVESQIVNIDISALK